MTYKDEGKQDFLELETSRTAINKFVESENARTREEYMGSTFDNDVRFATELLTTPEQLQELLRLEDWTYTFRQSSKNPRGVWLRIPHSKVIRADTEWEHVFDLDKFCETANEIWHWRGIIAPWFRSDRILLCLSKAGSDQYRYLEFDWRAKTLVSNGFDLPPERGEADWLSEDCLLWSTPRNGCATSSGWAGAVRKIERGMAIDDAPVVFQAEDTDLSVRAYVQTDFQSGRPVTFFSRYHEIGQETVTMLERDGREYVLPSPKNTEVFNTASHFSYIVKDENDEHGALYLASIDGSKTKLVFKPDERVSIDDGSIILLKNWLIFTVYDNLVPNLYALDLSKPDKNAQVVSLPEDTDSFWVTPHFANPDAGDETLQLHISGFLCSKRIYLFELASEVDQTQWKKIWQEPECFDVSGMEVRLLEATSKDGTKIPYHLVLPKQYENGKLPVLMYGYGGYGSSLYPYYSKLTGALWLARGGAYVMAHIRGGAEFGPAWHTQAKGPGRPRAFEDFAAIADDLVDRGLTKPQFIGCSGESNGGLLCGVMLTRYPEKFGAIWASVGVYDMLRFHEFTPGRAWIDEYGDPDNEHARRWLKAYSPIHNILPAEEIKYPCALIVTSQSDDRVDPSNSRRFVAHLRSNGHSPFFFEFEDSGHGGAGTVEAVARDHVLGLSFMRKQLVKR